MRLEDQDEKPDLTDTAMTILKKSYESQDHKPSFLKQNLFNEQLQHKNFCAKH